MKGASSSPEIMDIGMSMLGPGRFLHDNASPGTSVANEPCGCVERSISSPGSKGAAWRMENQMRSDRKHNGVISCCN